MAWFLKMIYGGQYLLLGRIWLELGMTRLKCMVGIVPVQKWSGTPLKTELWRLGFANRQRGARSLIGGSCWGWEKVQLRQWGPPIE